MMTNNFKRVTRTALAAAITLVLAGCQTMVQMNRDANKSMSSTDKQFTATMKSAKDDINNVNKGPDIVDYPYVSTVQVPHDTDFPASFNEDATFTSPANEPVSRILEHASEVTKIKVTADSDVTMGARTGTSKAASSRTKDATLSDMPSIGQLDMGAGSAGKGISAIAYIGKEKGVFDTIGTAIDAQYTYNKELNEIHYYRYVTKLFNIRTTSAVNKTDQKLTSGGSQQTTTGTQGQTVHSAGMEMSDESSDDSSIWTSLNESIPKMLSREGDFSIIRASHTVLVRDRYDRIADIQRFIDVINQGLSQGVEADVQVFRVSISNEDTRGISWSALYNTIGQNAKALGATISNPLPGNSSSLSSMVISAPSQTSSGAPSPWANSQFFLDALATLGNSSFVTEVVMDTVNNRTVTQKVVDDQGYLAQTTPLYAVGSTTSSSSSVVGAAASLIPGNVEYGVTASMTPNVQEDGKTMLMSMDMSISTLVGITSQGSGGNTIQLTHTQSRDFDNARWVTAGDVIVMAGFQQVQSGNTTQTPFGASTWMLGGNRDVTTSRDALVIVIQAKINEFKSKIQ